MDGIQKTADAYAAIDVSEIATIESDTASMVARNPDVAAILDDQWSSDLAYDFAVVAEHVRARKPLVAILRRQSRTPGRLNEIARIARALVDCDVDPTNFVHIKQFSRDQLRDLDDAIREIQDFKSSVFGYMFAGRKILIVSRHLRDRCKIECEKPHREITRLKSIRNDLYKILECLVVEGIEGEFGTAVGLVADRMAGVGHFALVPPNVESAVRRLEDAMALGNPLLSSANGRFYTVMLAESDRTLSLINEVGNLRLREESIKSRFRDVPKIDYVGSKSRIESLNTQSLAEHIDERFIEFYDTKKNDAIALGKIIREKKRFPIEMFADIQRAFPCIIAGLRDYAEFIPLEREIFDLAIIDEASQVSIAQALPAIIRAKKVLVFGDRNQFGNVKTSNASKEVNVAFMQDLIKSFTLDYAEVGDAIKTKIGLFNIKSSVLDFVEPISNFAIQLKKHFRSYPEMISFSSKYFYGDNIQVMKIRGKPIEDVIEFDAIDHDGKIDSRNVNVLEAERIIARIAECLDYDPLPTVGVITPHTEQQAYIAKIAAEHYQSEEFYDKLRLKIMTFDTCQGEEREIIFYSLVATEEKDRLGYVFPSKIAKENAEEVDHSLRLQRLNVGLSRGQEKIVFVHSKSPEKYASAMCVALQHYRNELTRAKSMPTDEDVDPGSPMERKVLHWLGQVPLIRDNDGDCEILANFELGRYLKQLDPAYNHPDYRVDFLIRISEANRHHQIVLEYDGFEFHFSKGIPSGMVNSQTWRSYLTEGDLEREKVLESFGYPMIRLNRFNLGDDPVATIDRLLRDRLNTMRIGDEPHELIKKDTAATTEIETGLKTGDYKRCKKCDRALPIEMFRDITAKSGVGHICRECKATASSSYGKPRIRRGYGPK
jgi:hypothetical protein